MGHVNGHGQPTAAAQDSLLRPDVHSLSPKK
jgi:hypothetical protein